MTAQTAQTRLTRSTCPYCGVGCGVVIESVGQQIVGVKGDPDHPANRGRLCTKGATLAQTAAAPIQRQTRLLQPLQRLQRGGPLTPLGWDAALDMAAAACLVLMACVAVAEERKIRRIKRELKAAELATQSA